MKDRAIGDQSKSQLSQGCDDQHRDDREHICEQPLPNVDEDAKFWIVWTSAVIVLRMGPVWWLS